MNGVGIADLKAHLSQHLRRVRAGRVLTVLDRRTPVARIVPLEAETTLTIRRALRRPPAEPAPPLPGLDSLTALLEDRDRR